MPIESRFKRLLRHRLDKEFRGIKIFKNDPSDEQGTPDLILLFGPRWAMLELKRSEQASKRPNQEYYVEQYGRMSYAAFISPEKIEEILDELHETFF